MKISRENFIQKLKQAGQQTREKIAQNADEEVRLRFFYEKFIWSKRQDDIIKETTLQNEIPNHISTEERGSSEEFPS